MKLQHTLVAIAVATAAAGATAATYDFGSHDPFVELSGAIPGAGLSFGGGNFLDFYTFSLGVDSLVSSTVVVNNQPGALGITNGVYTLVSLGGDATLGTSDDSALPVGYLYDTTTGGVQNTIQLAAGAYAYVVSGTLTEFAGYYSLSSRAVAAPIPEPTSAAMLLAGLGVAGIVARRRSRR